MQDLTTVAAVKSWIGGIPNGEVLEVLPATEGTGYHAATTTLSLSNVLGQGSGFAADPVVSAGKIVGVVIRSPGKLYLKGSPPTLTATDTDVSPGSGATFTLSIQEIDSTADALLSRLVSAASAFFYQRCSRSVLLGPATVTETRNGRSGQQYLVLLEAPVTAVASLSIDGRAATVSTGPNVPGYGFDADGIFLRGSGFVTGFSNITIVYSAGYAAGSQEAAMIEQAVIELVGTKYRRRTHIDEVSRGIAGGASQTVTFGTRDVSPEVQAAINKFQRVMVYGA
jgi:hypothetical protein